MGGRKIMTSVIIKNGASFIKQKKSLGEDIKIPRALSSPENMDFAPQVNTPDKRNSEIVEETDGKIKLKKVEIKTEISGFSYFLDGIERKRIVFYYRQISVIYGCVGAAIIKRTDKKLHSCGLEKFSENFYLPLKINSDAPNHYFEQEEIKQLGKNYINIGEKNYTGSYPILPAEFTQAAHAKIQTERNSLETSLAQRWCDTSKNDGWLFKDGRIEGKISGDNIAGIIKSHQACYFDYEEQYKIYTMGKGQRSSVFQPADKNGKKENVFSWYLRLHSDKRSGVNDFGIIRVEIPAKESLLKKVDEISSWILLETKPVGFPASRWDRMIYPIKYCEDYLKAKAPSWTMLESLS
jgi:hypothetical protein